MSVVRRDTYRRWGVVGGVIAVLCALPTAVAALPVHAPAVTPAALKARILASADHPYQGYAQSAGGLDLPELPQLGAVSSLLSGDTTLSTWFAGPQAWRTDVVTATGEQDMYQTAQGTVSWDFETGQITRVVGDPPVRLPQPSDLVPAELGLRLLHTASAADRIVALPARRVAGIAADGLEIQPASANTTIGRVDIWADPATGVPLQVAVYARGSNAPVISTRFLDVELTAPAAAAVDFTPAPGLPVSTAPSSDIKSLLDARARFPLPASLAGMSAAPALAGYGAAVSGYGTGFATFAVLYLGDRLGDSAFSAATAAGAAPVTFTHGTGLLIRTPLLSVVLARSDRFGRIYLLVGFTGSALLSQAASDLLTAADVFPPCGAHCPFPVGGRH